MKNLIIILTSLILISCTSEDVTFEFDGSPIPSEQRTLLDRKMPNPDLTFDERVEWSLHQYYIFDKLSYRSLLNEDLGVDLRSYLLNYHRDNIFASYCKIAGIDPNDIPNDYFGPAYEDDPKYDVVVYRLVSSPYQYLERDGKIQNGVRLITNEDYVGSILMQETEEGYWFIDKISPPIKKKKRY